MGRSSVNGYLKDIRCHRAVNQRGQKPGFGKIKELEISPKFLIQFLISSPLIF